MSKDSKYKPNIIIDNGQETRAGFSGEAEPRIIFPTLIGKPKNSYIFRKNFYFGQETLFKQNQDYLNIINPFEQGYIDNWNDLEYVWDYIFKEKLEVDPSVIMSCLLYLL